VIILVDLPKVDEKPLGIGRLLKVFQSHRTDMQNSLLLGMKDKNITFILSPAVMT
jgi:hypothetical protein